MTASGLARADGRRRHQPGRDDAQRPCQSESPHGSKLATPPPGHGYLGCVPEFKLNPAYTATADQPSAIESLAEGIRPASASRRCSA